MRAASAGFTEKEGTITATLGGDASIVVPSPVDCLYIGGGSTVASYSRVESGSEGELTGEHRWSHGGFDFALEDVWRVAGEGRVSLERHLRVEAPGGETVSPALDGFQLHLSLGLPRGGDWQFFSPRMLYSPGQRAAGRLVTFNDDRLAYPMVAAYNPSTGRAVCLSRVSLPAFDNAPRREPGLRSYTQDTDIGSSGFSRAEGVVDLHLFWP